MTLRKPMLPQGTAAWLLIFAVTLICENIALAASPATAGDVRRGHEIYQQCIGCHSLDRNRTGPRHCGLIGRRVGSVPDYTYSGAMKKLDFIWTYERLDRFLESPFDMIPETSMGYAGIKNASDRRDLIAYIEFASRSSELCATKKR